MTGISYTGTMPFAVATTGVEGLKTIVPVAGIADWYSQQNMQGSQRYWPQEALNSFLAYYCSSRYHDETLSEKELDDIAAFHHELSLQQLSCGSDYNEEFWGAGNYRLNYDKIKCSVSEKELDDIAAFHHELSLQQLSCGSDYNEEFWGAGNYRLNYDKIKCSALIVQGLRDENVFTKHFEMMYKAYKKSGQTVKTILHQGPHITPTLPSRKYGILIDGNFYDDIVNKWITHYLYDIDQTVKTILHQGPHITPTLPSRKYGILIDGNFYDDIVNKWITHYLYDIDNSVEEMPEVLAQTNYDQNKWETCDSWETAFSMKLESAESGVSVIDSDWEKADICAKNFDESMSSKSSNMNKRFVTAPLDKEFTLQGTVSVIDSDWEKADICAKNFDESMSSKSSNMNKRFVTAPLDKEFTLQGTVHLNLKAALKDGDIENDFNPENVNNADSLTMKLGNSKITGRMDDVKLVAMLYDICDEKFDSIQAVDPERNVIPVVTVKEGGIINGGDLPAFNLCEYETSNKNYCIVGRAYADLCNPEAGYEPETAVNSIELKKGEYHEYNIYITPNRYTFKPGHRLALVITTEDPVNCLIHAVNSIELKKGEYHEYNIYITPNRYTFKPGHRLALVITTEDPVNCLIHKTYSVEIDNASVNATLPVTEEINNIKVTIE